MTTTTTTTAFVCDVCAAKATMDGPLRRELPGGWACMILARNGLLLENWSDHKVHHNMIEVGDVLCPDCYEALMGALAVRHSGGGAPRVR